MKKKTIIEIILFINTILFFTGLSMVNTECNYQSIIISLITLFIYIWFVVANKKRIKNYIDKQKRV